MPSNNDPVLNRVKQWHEDKMRAVREWTELFILISLAVTDVKREFETRFQALKSAWLQAFPGTNVGELILLLDECQTELLSLAGKRPETMAEIEFEIVQEVSVHRRQLSAIGAAADYGLTQLPKSVPAFAENDRNLLLDYAKEALELQNAFQVAQDTGMGFPFDCAVLASLPESLQLVALSKVISIVDWFNLEIARKRFRIEAIRLARWISFTDSLPMPPASHFRDQLPDQQNERESFTTESGTTVFADELTREVRPSRDWRIIFGYSKESDQIVPMSKSSFYQRIKGESGITIDAVKCGRGYRLRTDQLPSGAKSEALRNDIIKQASEQKKN